MCCAANRYSYDTASRLLYVDNQTQNGQHKYAYLYDKVGNRTSMMVTDSGGTRTHVYTYDNIYQVTEVDYPSGFEYLATDTEFNYDAAGNRTSVIDGSGTCTYTSNTLNQYTAAGSTSYQYDDSGNMVHDATYAYGYDPENRLVLVRKSGPYGTLTLGEALDSPLTYTTGGSGNWTTINGGEGHEDLNSASAPSLAQGQESWLQTTVEGAGTFSFWAKIDPNDAGNELKFYVDDTLRYSCGAAEWEQFSWAVTGAGTHTLKWVYRRNSQSTAGEGYVDDVGWTGSLPALPPPEPAATNWRYLTYTYDVGGRRIEKKYDYETITKYVYDGDHCIAEYNAYNQLKRKYIYGPGVDQPICLIDSMTSPAVTSYYHFDGLGSVTALTNFSGNTVQVYEYDVYGRAGATDASHPNRILFTGREYDKETGLYYYRARYYNPQIGRFLQTDPVGYGDGMNWYAYCSNNPVNGTDAAGEMSWWDWASTAYVRGVHGGDTRAYFSQDVRFQTCAIQSTANLYAAQDGQLGEQRRNHLIVRMKAAWPDVGWGAVDRFSVAPGFIMDTFERQLQQSGKLKGAMERNNPDYFWGNNGLPDLSYVAGFVQNDMPYMLYSRPEGARPMGFRDVNALMEKGPVLLALSTRDGGGRRAYNPSDFHCVVVRLSRGTTSKIGDDWVETPYEVIDPIWGTLYYTQDEFAKILSLAADQMVIPK